MINSPAMKELRNLTRMEKIILLALVITLTGCIGKVNKGPQYAKNRSVYIDRDRVCFSVDKKRVLSNYDFSVMGKIPKVLLRGRSTHLSYPESCFMVPLERGVIYRASYMLDQKNYYDTFIIDSSGHVIYLWAYTDCPYMSIIPW